MQWLLPCSDIGQSTPEYLALRNSYRLVVTHVSTQTSDICGALFEKGYVPPAVLNYVTTDGIPSDKKAEKVVSTLMTKVELDPNVYHGFMSILKSEGPWADAIIKELEEAYKAEQSALADCDRSSEDSFHSLPDPDTPAGKIAKPEASGELIIQHVHMQLHVSCANEATPSLTCGGPGGSFRPFAVVCTSLVCRTHTSLCFRESEGCPYPVRSL